jgi:RNA polymerase primary sigma factor
MQDPSLRSYLNQLGRFPLLRPEQEIELSRKVLAMMELVERERAGDTLTADEVRTVKRGLRAKQRFMEANLRLVVGVAKKHQQHRRSLELLDLIQEGNIGLARAVEKFDPARGYKFSTYAYWWIRQSIQHAIQHHDLIVRLPVTVHNQLIKVGRATEDLVQELGREPAAAEVAQRLEIDLKTLTEAIRLTRYISSLDKELPGCDGDCTYADVLGDPNAPTPDEQLAAMDAQDDAERLEGIVNRRIDPRARDVLLSRHGDTTEPWADMERRTGLTRCVLQRIESRALNQCRRLMRGLPVAAIAAAPSLQPALMEQVSLFDL